MNQNLRRWLLFLAVAAVSLVGDLVTKEWAVEHLASPRHPLLVTVAEAQGGLPLAKVLEAQLGSQVGLDEVRRLGAPKVVDPEALLKDSGLLAGSPGLLLATPGSRALAFVENPYAATRRAENPVTAVQDLDATLRDQTVGGFLADKAKMGLAQAEKVVRDGNLYVYPAPGAGDPTAVKAGDRFLVTQREMTLIDGLLRFIYVENPGAAWGFMAKAPPTLRRTFLGGVSLLAMILIFFMFRGMGRSRLLPSLSLGLILGGAAGNFVDRLVAGQVVDFIQMFLGSYEWPTYNVADIAISVGVGLVLLDSLSHRDKKDAATEA